jgi:hypothetical protein
MTGPRTLAADYDVYELAFLAGGPRRAVETAVVSLVENGRLRVTGPTGALAVVDARRGHALEAAVLDAVGVRGHRSIDTVRWRVESDDRLAAVARRLESDGLVRPGAATDWRRRHWQLALTGEGRRTLRHLRGNPPAGRTAPSPSAVLVALVGPSGLADREVRSALFEPPRLPRAPRSRGPLARRRDVFAAGYDHRTYAVLGFGGDGGGFGGGFAGGCGDGGGGGGGDGGGGC